MLSMESPDKKYTCKTHYFVNKIAEAQIYVKYFNQRASNIINLIKIWILKETGPIFKKTFLSKFCMIVVSKEELIFLVIHVEFYVQQKYRGLAERGQEEEEENEQH